ncbi:MAG: L-threonylcarbamoyladenylate synthase [Kiritimatiellales bacterium]
MNRVVKIDSKNPAPDIIRRTCELLSAGHLIVIPTETVYGIACAPEFIEKLYTAKERERGKPVARLAAGIEQVKNSGAVFTEAAEKLAGKYWPGPLTIILETPEGNTGFRVPAHAVPLAIAREFGRPVALTSANKSGGADAVTVQEAFETLSEHVALFLDAGTTTGKIPSTVVRCTGNGVEILRAGAISEEQLMRVCFNEKYDLYTRER